MPQLPPELRVEIRKVGDQFLAVTSRSNDKEICSNLFAHDAEKLVHVGPQWMLEKGARSPDILRADDAATPRPPDDQLLVSYGQRLYGYLFGDGAKLQDLFEFNDTYRPQARLTLCLHPEASALWGLPWEYLHDGREFLCLSERLLLNRVPLGVGELAPAEAAPPLRILVVIAAPEDQAELDVEKELAVIQDALDEARRAGLVQVDYLYDATLPALQDALGRQAYHVLQQKPSRRLEPARGSISNTQSLISNQPVQPQFLQLIPRGRASRFVPAARGVILFEHQFHVGHVTGLAAIGQRLEQ